jgi:hypothetical protein
MTRAELLERVGERFGTLVYGGISVCRDAAGWNRVVPGGAAFTLRF